MVVSSQPLASRVGLEVLQRGGNAVDAAVAVGFALAVVHPEAGNLGGGGFMTVAWTQSGQDFTLDFRETAPAAAGRDMYLDASGNLVEGLSTRSHLASGVPGSVAGLHEAWRRWGSLPWADLVGPAIRLAAEGFPVSQDFARSLRQAAGLLSRHPESRRILLGGERPLSPGDRLVQPELAATLTRIAQHGPEDFYLGTTADLLVAEMRRGGGLITHQDLREYEVRLREPIRGVYRGLEVVSMGPPSSGGIILIEMLNMLERYPLGELGFGTPDELHLKAEVMKRAFADRAAYLGDADFVEIPTTVLTSKAWAEHRAADIRMERTSPSVGPGTLPESPHTTHYSVMDERRNAVAVTTTLNASFGSGVMVNGAGFLLNNQMDDFTTRLNQPNLYGLIQGEANLIAPRKRPLSAMTPTVVKRNGLPYLVLGSPGGPTIINSVLQVLINVVDHGMGLQEAVDAPRIHHQWRPEELVAEEGSLREETAGRLRAKGHRLRWQPRIGETQCILFDAATGTLQGVADLRRGGEAVGY
jgi:gamma-glutamyltranspeptidase/glutathione hydrolase